MVQEDSDREAGRVSLSSVLPGVVGAVVVLICLYVISRRNYLLFHSLAEVFSVVIAFAIFALCWNSHRLLRDNHLVFLAIAYLFVGGIDLLHTLAYSGMGVFQTEGGNLATQLWVSARYLESMALLAMALLVSRRIRPSVTFGLYGLISFFLLSSIFWWRIFPTCYVEGSGLTAFKIESEYAIIAMLAVTAAVLVYRRKEFDRFVGQLLIASVFATIASEAAFTLYKSPTGPPNLVGHFLKIVSFYLIYKAIIETGIVRPYSLLFRDLKVQDEELRHERARLRAILDQMLAGVIVAEAPSGRMRLGNQAFEAIWRRPFEPCASIDEYDTYRGYRPDGRPYEAHEWPLARAILDGEVVSDEEIEFLRGDGTVGSMLASATPVRSLDGRIVAAVATFHDISERKRMEEALQETWQELETRVRRRTAELAEANEALQAEIAERKEAERRIRQSAEQWQTTFDAITEALCILGLDATIQQANEAMSHLTGLPRSRLVGRRCYNVMQCPWKDGQALCPVAMMKHSRERETVTRHIGDRWFRVTADPLFDEQEKLVGAVHIIRDITDQVEAQQALSESNALLERVFDTTHMLIAYLDTGFCFIRVNRAYAEAHGHPQSFFPGKNHFELFPGEENRRAFQRVLETGEPHFAHARWFHHNDADRSDATYWDWSLLPVQDEGGKVDGLLLCLVDVTERERAVARIRAYQSELRSLASELILAEERERRRIATELHDQLGQTLAISKIKLGAVRARTSSEAATELVDETRRLLDRCIRYARSLTFELGSPVLSEVGLEAALQELAHETQKRHALQTKFETDGRPKPLDGDIRVLLFQAVRELLLNVVKHARARRATISVVRANGRVRVSVEDDGIGFDAEMFEQQEFSTRGYGLFSIRERMDHMGGSFQITSEPQKGTVACLEAPLSGESSDPDGADDDHPHPAG